MRNIFLFIRRYFTFIAFVVLQIISLWMLFNYNRFHRAVGMGAASQFTGAVNKQVDRLDDYFHQGEENKRVHRMNDSLINLLQSNFTVLDSNQQVVADTVLVDSTKTVRRYYWRDAKVIYNTVNFEKKLPAAKPWIKIWHKRQHGRIKFRWGGSRPGGKRKS